MLLKEFIKDKKIAAISESSKFVVKQICNEINFAKAKIIVELGPGRGVITKALLKKISPSARIIVIEQNREFVRNLVLINDRRLNVVHGNAEKIKEILAELNLTAVDYIISGIPFSLIKDRVGAQIVLDAHEVLSENGFLIAYQFRDKVLDYIKTVGFRKIKTKIELINLPPVQIFIAKK